MSALDIADVLIGTISDDAAFSDLKSFTTKCKTVAANMGVVWKVPSKCTSAQVAMIVKGAVVAQFDRMNVVSSIAASRGYLLPDNPFSRFRQLNGGRQLGKSLGISADEDAALELVTNELSKIALDFDSGKVTFDRHEPAIQLSSFEVSLDGISNQSGDPLVDILGYQPDEDFVKRKRAIDSLAKLDFSKRKPYLLFTADVIRDGKRQDGTIICWQRMRDASAYTISKRNVFGMFDLPDSTYKNSTLERSTAALKANSNFIQILSFYDWVGPNDFLATVDEQVEPNTLYSYSIAGLQTKAPSSHYVFDVPTSALYLSLTQANQIKSLIQSTIQTFGLGADVDSISPYPAISQIVYGDPGHGWVLAGCNVLAAIRRGDSADNVRKLSFIGSRSSDLISQASAGKLVVPGSIAAIHQSIDSSISAYGISQTLLAILDGTGMTEFISGKDDPLGLKSTPAALQNSTGGLAKILAAIDPQTATVDPHALVSSLTAKSADPKSIVYISKAVLGALRGVSAAEIPSLESVLGSEVIDLTTYVGIDTFMQMIRSIYDFFPAVLT